MTTKTDFSYIIRDETESDYHESELLVKRAFWNKYRPGCCEHYLLHKLRNDPAYLKPLSKVAEADGRIIGLIAYSRATLQTADGAVPTATFGPLCVDPDYQRRGVGERLVRETLALAAAAGQQSVIIFGDPAYYSRFGFKPCAFWGVTTSDGANFPAFMGVELTPGALGHSGARFAEVDVFENLPDSEVDEFDRQFPRMEKKKLPGQLVQ